MRFHDENYSKPQCSKDVQNSRDPWPPTPTFESSLEGCEKPSRLGPPTRQNLNLGFKKIHRLTSHAQSAPSRLEDRDLCPDVVPGQSLLDIKKNRCPLANMNVLLHLAGSLWRVSVLPQFFLPRMWKAKPPLAQLRKNLASTPTSRPSPSPLEIDRRRCSTAKSLLGDHLGHVGIMAGSAT